MISAVLFDYGGTLVIPRRGFEETKPSAIRSAYETLSRSGLTVSYEEYLERNNAIFERYSALEKKEGRDISDHIKYQEMVDEFFPSHSEVWRRRVARRANDSFWAVITGNYPIRKNTRSTLSKLRSMDIRLGIISNHHNHGALVKHVKALGIASNFSCIMSSVKSGMRKPDARIFESCLRSMNVELAAEAVFVGDSPENDVQGAQSAGLHTILIADDPPLPEPRVGTGTAKPDFTIRNLAEIPAIVSSL